MAAKVNFSESLRRPLQRAKCDCLGQTSSGDGVKKVNDFFSELEVAVEVLEEKFGGRSSFANVQRLLPARGMVARALRKAHTKIIRHLHTRPKLANPWLGEFTMDMPEEVFSCLSKDVMARTNYGHQTTETTTLVKHRITHMRKARYLFARMDLDGSEVSQEYILRKPMENSLNDSYLERCEVVVSEEKPLELNFHKKNEVLTVKFHYGYWNTSGVQQH